MARDAFSNARDNEISFLAAGVAYYALVSVFPALLLALVVASTLGRDEIATYVVGVTGDYLSPSVRSVVVDAVAGGSRARGRGGATVAGVVFLVWSALKVFRGLDSAFSRIYGSSVDGSIVERTKDAFTVVASLGLAAAATSAGGTVVGGFGNVFLFVSLAAFLVPLYYFLPDVEASVGDVLPGALIAAVSITLLRVLFEVYASNTASYGVYGVAGAFLLLATWFYLASLALLAGASVNAVLYSDSD